MITDIIKATLSSERFSEYLTTNIVDYLYRKSIKTRNQHDIRYFNKKSMRRLSLTTYSNKSQKKVYMTTKCRHARHTACQQNVQWIAACKEEQLRVRMPHHVETCKYKKCWKVFLWKFFEETISRNPWKSVSEVLRCLRLTDQSYEWPLKRNTPVQQTVDGQSTLLRRIDTDNTEDSPE